MIARKSALIVATNILNGALGYVALFFITRYMSPEEYGLVAFALGFVTLFAIFGKLGYGNAHIKRVSEGKDLGTCIGTFLTIKIGLAGLMASVLIGAIFFWKVVMGQGFETSAHELAIYIMMGYWAIRLFAQSFITTFTAKKEIAKVQTTFLLETLVRVALIIYVAIAGFGAIALAFTYVAGEIGYFLLALYFFRRLPIKKPSKDYFKDYSKFAFPLIIVAVCSDIMTNIDKILIQLFWSSADVGYYFAAFRLSKFINMFTLAIGMLLFPTFSMLHANNNIAGIRKLTFKSERYLSMVVFPMVFGMVLLAEPAAKILLSGWMPAVPLLQILPFLALLAALERPYQSQFLGMNRPKLARNRVLIMVCFNVVLNIVLIPKDIQIFDLDLVGMGARGAAIATVVAYGVGLMYSRVMAWKLTGIKGNPRVLLHAGAGGVMVAILYVLLYNLNMIVFIARWYHLLGFALFGLGIYIGVLYLLREFTKEDLHFFLDVLNIKKMFRYIKEEIRGK
ncbi:MAG: flippase [Thermoplasmatales archaeon]|nr:flippase [Thermoplasmatales archaeon]MCK5260597.1 flippase [Thermoplasmatales archaeon]